MSNYTVRDNFKDIFGVYFLESLSFEGDYDMPIVGNFDDISVIDYIALYSDTSEYNKTENTCVAFYQYDHVFDVQTRRSNSGACCPRPMGCV